MGGRAGRTERSDSAEGTLSWVERESAGQSFYETKASMQSRHLWGRWKKLNKETRSLLVASYCVLQNQIGCCLAAVTGLFY